MIVEAQATINGSKEKIWAVITDIENASARISSIDSVEVLGKPDSGLIGLRWREIRTIFGKSATEVMWITDAAENEFYETRAESHGSIYISRFSISEQDGSSSLTMTHDSEPQAFLAKILSVPLGFVFKGAMKKAMQRDVDDIKAAVEEQQGS